MLVSVATGSTLLAACGGGDSGQGAPASTPVTHLRSTGHAIHVLVPQGDGRQAQLDFGPGSEIFGSKTSPSAKAQSLGLLDFDGGGSQVLPEPTIDNPGRNINDTAWALLARASSQCGSPNIAFYQFPPWSSWDGAKKWFLWEGIGSSCAYRLSLEQNLICVADKLAEIGDAVGTVVWPEIPNPGWCPPYGTLPPYQYGSDDAGAQTGGCDVFKEWHIPPQADKDRFIVRDLAIHTLGILATLDAVPVNAEGTTEVCSTTFGRVATGNRPVATDADSYAVFGVPLKSNNNGTWKATFPDYPPSDVPILDADYDGSGNITATRGNNARNIARSALDVEAQILRGGGRLLHDLVRRSVYSDMASAAQQSAQAMDPDRGNQLAWGVEDPFGSYAHAARLLTGRWEIGTGFESANQPRCEGVAAIDLLNRAFGDERSARVEDRPVRTKGEALASQLVERAGIVVPTCNTTNAASLRSALTDELLLQEEVRNGMTVNLQSPQRAIFDRITASLADGEVIFAFKRAYRTYRLLTDSADNTGTTLSDGGVSCAAVPLNVAGLAPAAPNLVAASVTALDGVVVSGGIARERLTTDPIARAGGMMEASQCGENVAQWSEWGTTTEDRGVSQDSVPPSLFQDSFHLGQAFERRLSLLRAAADPVKGGTGDPEAVARGAIAELRSWAGSGIVHAWQQSMGTGPNKLAVRVTGLPYSDLGLDPNMPAATRQTALLSAFGWVYGPPWVAECAAHVRNDCPANFDATYVQGPSQVSDDPTGATLPANSGAIGPVINFLIPIDPSDPGRSATSFAPQLNNFTVGNNHLYMVLRHDSRNPLGRGAVLGTIPMFTGYIVTAGAPPWLNKIASFVISPMQRELVDDAIDLGKWVGARPPRIGDPSAAESSGYCVDGVPRDIFVPLDNELTADNTSFEDSWKHYLDLAQQAAQRADDLGQQLINLDLQIDQRKEAAGEALADLCGDFGIVDHVTVANDGSMKPNAEDPTLAMCLSEPVTHVVFVGNVPSDITTYSGGPTKYIRDKVLKCGSGQANASDDLCDAAKYPTLSYDALNIAPTNPPPSDPCAQLTNIAQSTRTGFQGSDFRSLLDDPKLNTDGMATLATALRMEVDGWNNWHVKYAGQIIMASYNASYWPACLKTANGCSALPADAGRLAATLNMAFRWCPGATTSAQLLAAPLGCDGSVNANGSPQDAELNVLKWRVMQAMWMIGVSAGQVPHDMFNVPVPIVTYPPAQNGMLVPFYAAYPGTMAQQGACNTAAAPAICPWKLQIDATNGQGDVDTLNTAWDIAPAFGAFTNNAGNEIPAWYRNLLTAGVGANGQVKQRWINNGDISLTNCNYATLFGVASDGNPPNCPVTQPHTALSIPLTQLVDTGAWSLDGVTCPNMWGEPTAGGTPRGNAGNGHLLWQLLATAKTGLDELPGGMPPTQRCGYTIQNNAPYWSCDNNATSFDFYPTYSGYSVTNATGITLAKMTQATPWQRSPEFLGMFVPNGSCAALSTLVQPAAIACSAAGISLSSLNPLQPPAINSVSDIVQLEGWLGMTSKIVLNSVGILYAEKIPQRVVTDFKTNQVGTGTKKGAHGQAMLEIEQALSSLPGTWTRLATDLNQVSNAIQSARLAMSGANLQAQSQIGQIALQEIQTQGQMAQAGIGFLGTVAGAFSSTASSGGAGAAGAFLSIGVGEMAMSQSLDTGNQELDQLNANITDVQRQEQNQVAIALADLSKTTGPIWSDVQTALDDIRATVTKVMTAAEQLQLAQSKAQYQAALGTGEDFVSIAGQQVAIPVNTVLRRQSSATQIRYQRALDDAKALSYMARRAIEQRIGVPLNAITTRVGPLDAPASWADDVCSLTGVNYKALSTATPRGQDGGGIGGSLDQAAINQFADSFIGDYVQKLRDFVAYYNAQYPSHEGDDTAVLSLRSDLLGPVSQCTQQAPNILVSSGNIDNLVSTSGTQLGWELHPCAAGSSKCLTALSGGILASPLDGPTGAQNPSLAANIASSSDSTGVSWLSDVAGGASSAGAGAPDGGSGAARGDWPTNMVSQSVHLDPGAYVLSWWDQARRPDGSLASTPSGVEYVARVYDAHWNQVASFHALPYVAAPGEAGAPPSLWSARNVLKLSIASSGIYRVAFAASLPGSGVGNVAIADVQLEAAPPSGDPSAYVQTGNSRTVVGYDCPRSAAGLRSAFRHDCDRNGSCYYELTAPLIVDTDALNAGGSSLAGKLAQGNFNFRHITLAANLVGTGLRDCGAKPTPDCYGTGYIEYTLEHDATSAGILDYNGDQRIFDFGIANVQHGKALAAERYISMPVSSGDQQLLNQPGIQHMEFRGRPLDGAYRLRIYDSPALHWERLEDIQLILNYRYWSQIVANGAAGH